MAQYDGTLKFDTKIDSKGFNAGLTGIGNAMAKAGKALANFKSVSKTMAALNKATMATAGFSKLTKAVMVFRNVLTAAGAAGRVLVAVLGVVTAVIGALVLVVAAVGMALVGMFASGYIMAERYVNKLSESISKTSYMYDEILKMKQAFVDVRETARTLFTPLLFAAMPILTKITGWIIKMLTTIQMVMAALLGQKTVMQYVAGSAKSASDATGSLAKNTKKAGEAAEGALAAFDELNVLQMQKEEPAVDVGGGGGGADLGRFAQVPISEKIQKIIDDIKNWFKDAWKFIGDTAGVVWDWIVEKATAAWNLIVKVATWAWDNVLGPVWNWLKETASNTWDWLVENVFAPIGAKLVWLGGVFKEAGKAIYDTFIAPVVAWFRDTLLPWLTKNVMPIIKVAWEGLLQFFRNIWQWIGTAFTNAWNLIVSILKNIGLAVSGAIQGMITFFGGLIQFITGVFTGNWAKAWEGIKNIFKGVWETIKSLSKGFVNSIIDVINFMIRSVVSGLNGLVRALNRISITIPDWVPEFGGRSFGVNLREVSAPQIPRLATGAVIPPNASFLAMLGDQRNGTNIEAPEELIRQIVREETGAGRDITINFGGTLGALVRELKPYIDKENARIGRSLVKGATS